MLGDPEAAPHVEGASGSLSPIRDPLCATEALPLEWVPNCERPVVPPEVADMCGRCPGRQECLLLALATESTGYWAGTTTRDRQRMAAAGAWTLEEADQIRRRPSPVPVMLHAAGQGSTRNYRQGCHCVECRLAHSQQAARDRKSARSRRVQVRPLAA